MRAVDTNGVVRLVTLDDLRQTAAAEAFVASGAWISHLVLMEAVWVLRTVYGLDRQKIATAVEMLLQHRNLTLQDPDVVEAALQKFRLPRTERAPGFSDCLILEVARKAGHLPLGTFDQKLGELEGAQVL
jgi:predicted nucleic-acid-binding protein